MTDSINDKAREYDRRNRIIEMASGSKIDIGGEPEKAYRAGYNQCEKDMREKAWATNETLTLHLLEWLKHRPETVGAGEEYWISMGTQIKHCLSLSTLSADKRHAEEIAELERMDAEKGAMLQAKVYECSGLNLSISNFRKEIKAKNERIADLSNAVLSMFSTIEFFSQHQSKEAAWESIEKHAKLIQELKQLSSKEGE